MRAATGLDRGDVARREQLHERLGVNADLHAFLHTDVPQRCPLQHVPVFVDRRVVADRHPHPVVRMELGGAVLDRLFEERRLLDAG